MVVKMIGVVFMVLLSLVDAITIREISLHDKINLPIEVCDVNRENEFAKSEEVSLSFVTSHKGDPK